MILGDMYSDGEKLEKDLGESKHYYELAFSQGYSQALIKLGDLYVTKDAKKEEISKALSYYELADQHGVAEAAFRIGSLYEKRIGTKPDYLKAAPYYKKAMEAGNLEAQSRLGSFYFHGFLGKRQPEKGIDLVLDAISKGHETAEQEHLAYMFFLPRDDVDSKKAFEFNLLQANKNYANAQYCLAKFYKHGIGTTKNDSEARKWMKTAASNGQRQAIAELGIDAYNNKQIADSYYYLNQILDYEDGAVPFTLGMILLYGGQGLSPNVDRAIHLFRKALDLGNAPAHTQLGIIYLKGNGVPKNEKYGFNLLKKNAEEGEPNAQAILGECYKLGTGAPINIPLAVEWFSKASSQGNLMAKEYLYTMYSSGSGVEKDPHTAIKLLKEILASKDVKNRNHFTYRLAIEYDEIERFDLSIPIYQQLANSGDDEGQYMLGLHYKYGIGVSQNFDTAKFWIKKSAAQNNELAKESLKELEG